MPDNLELKLRVDDGQSTKTLLGLETKLTSLKQKIKEVGIGSSEFKKLSTEIRKTESEVKNLNKSFEGLDKEAMAGEFGKLAGGITAAFTGIAAIAGDANEEFEKTIATIAKGMAVAQGFKGAAEAVIAITKLWKIAQATLNAVMAANPILAIITAIVALIAIIGSLVWWLGSLETQEEKNIKANESWKESIKEINKITDDWVYNLKLIGLKYDELTGKIDKTTADQKNIQAKAYKEMSDLGEKYTQDSIKIKEEYDKWLEENEGASYEVRAQKYKEYQQIQNKLRKDYENTHKLIAKTANEEIINLEEDKNKEIEEDNKKSQEKRLKDLEDFKKKELEIVKRESNLILNETIRNTDKYINNEEGRKKAILDIANERIKGLMIEQSLMNELGEEGLERSKEIDDEIKQIKADTNKAIDENELTSLQFRNDLEMRYYELSIRGLENYGELWYEKKKEQLENELDLIKEKYGEESDEYKEHLLKMEELKTEGDEYKKEKDLENWETEYENTISRYESILHLDKKFFDDQRDALKDALDKKLITNEEYLKKKKELDGLEIESERAKLAAVADVMGQSSKLFGEHTAAHKVLASTQAAINTFLSASNAYNALSGIPVVGPVLAAIAAATAVASGLAQVAKINAVDVPSYGRGGILQGPSHSQGGILTNYGELEGNEGVINSIAMSNPAGVNLAAAANRIGGGVDFSQGDGTISLSSETISQIVNGFNDKEVYVVESEITGKQTEVREIKEISTLF
jgi:hypothetical protein